MPKEQGNKLPNKDILKKEYPDFKDDNIAFYLKVLT
jgi:hypothetical protein